MIQWILRVQIQQRRNLILQTSFFLMMMIIMMMIRVFLTLQIPLFTIGKPQAEVENIIKQITRESLVAPINQNSQYFERMEKIKYSSYPLSFMFHSSHITSVTNQISDELRSLRRSHPRGDSSRLSPVSNFIQAKQQIKYSIHFKYHFSWWQFWRF